MSHQHHHAGEGDGHHHGHQRDLQRKFRFAVLLTGLVFLVELIGGILSNSLALLSDAAHVFSDALSLILSWLAIYLSTRPATNSRTYGYHRTEVFAAFVNGASLLALSVWIFYEAVQRFMAPEPVKSREMLIVAIIGFAGNMLIVWLFHGEGHRNLNVRSAVLHVIGDALASVGVIVGGVIIYWTGWFIVDSLLSGVIGVIILVGAWRVTKESTYILLESSPDHADADKVAQRIGRIDAVKDVHDIHIWSLCSNYYALSAHVLLEENTPKSSHELLQQINTELQIQFGIFHTTIQIEHVGCPHEGNLLCNAPHH
ncbi:MAG: cation diffusion facilitator family transporter [Candidatus Poribacteria bacterium]|nr:cation diffusion facilitator family transporter [Candidatus Poribacteria bacterium]